MTVLVVQARAEANVMIMQQDNADAVLIVVEDVLALVLDVEALVLEVAKVVVKASVIKVVPARNKKKMQK